MKIIKPILKLLIALIIIFFVAMGIRLFTVENNLTELKTKHFLIEYKGIYKSNAEEIAESLENNYDRIRAELKDPEHETIKVFLHGNQTDFNEKSGLIHAKRAAIRLHHRSGDPSGDRLRIVSAFELCQGARKVI